MCCTVGQKHGTVQKLWTQNYLVIRCLQMHVLRFTQTQKQMRHFTWLATADARRPGISRGLSIASLKRLISVPYVTRKNEFATMNK